MGNYNTNFWVGICSGIIAFIIGKAAFLIGGFDNALAGLVVFMCVDYTTGILYAGSIHNIASRKSLNGIRKKISMLLLVLAGHWLDIVSGSGGFMRNTIIMLLVATEGISIVENLGKMGIRVPKVFQDTFATFHVDLAGKSTKGGEENENDKNKKQ